MFTCKIRNLLLLTTKLLSAGASRTSARRLLAAMRSDFAAADLGPLFRKRGPGRDAVSFFRRWCKLTVVRRSHDEVCICFYNTKFSKLSHLLALGLPETTTC